MCHWLRRLNIVIHYTPIRHIAVFCLLFMSRSTFLLTKTSVLPSFSGFCTNVVFRKLLFGMMGKQATIWFSLREIEMLPSSSEVGQDNRKQMVKEAFKYAVSNGS